MRISDWSSDVCSSDLSAAATRVSPTTACFAPTYSPCIGTPTTPATDAVLTIDPFVPRSIIARIWYFMHRNVPVTLISMLCRNRSSDTSASGSPACGVAALLNAPSSPPNRSEEHTSELQSLMRISYAVFCLKKKTYHRENTRALITKIHNRSSTQPTYVQHKNCHSY